MSKSVELSVNGKVFVVAVGLLIVYYTVFAIVPTITVQITDGEVTPSIGHGYTLTCSISGAENLNDTLPYYEWRSRGQLLSSNSSTLHFYSLKLSDAGRYTCQASVTSNYLHEPITMVESHNLVIKSKPQSILV